jgi:AcrR family transcriptional regulator
MLNTREVIILTSHSKGGRGYMTETTNDKRAAIVKTAIRLFTIRGFYGTPTALIAKEAGVSNGTLFRYFPTKEELINSAYYEIKERTGKNISEGVADEKTLEAKARRMWRNIILWGVTNPDEFLFMEQFSSSPFITKLPEGEIMKNYAPVYEVLLEIIKTGNLKNGDPNVAMIMIFSTTRGVVRSIIDSKGALDTGQSIEQSFRLVWNGIAGK